MEDIMTDNTFRTLQKTLDTYSLGFPPTESGVELELLRELFTEDEARFFLKLSPKLETPEDIAARLELPVEEVRDRAEDMASRGLLFRLRKGDTARYGAIPFMHGLVEFSTPSMTPRMAELLEKYFHEAFNEAISRSSGLFLRTIPIGQSVTPEQHVASFDDAVEILKQSDPIVVTECTCRKQKGILERSCGKPLEACFMFGSMGKYYIDNNIGRQVSLDEALAIVKECNEAGLVIQPGTSQNPAGMCNCCGDCCAVLAGLKLLPKPAEAVFSNHYAVADDDLCTGCGACIDRCQMEALTLSDSTGLIQVNNDRCIGCGLCITACPSGALTLADKEEGKRLTPPASNFEQMMILAQKRGII